VAAAQECPAQGGRSIKITTGTLACADAYATVAKYDFNGEKFQEIGAFKCQTLSADVAPMIMVCASEAAEFSVSEG